MRSVPLIAAAAMSVLHLVAATPVLHQAAAAASSAAPVPGKNGSMSLPATGAQSCPAETLSADTWTKLNLDKFLAAWVKANVTAAKSNNVQALAQSFGAPNFFWYVPIFADQGFTYSASIAPFHPSSHAKGKMVAGMVSCNVREIAT